MRVCRMGTSARPHFSTKTGRAGVMRPPKLAFIAPREVSRMANEVFFGVGVAGDSAVFTRSDEGYFFSDGQECPSYITRSISGRARALCQPLASFMRPMRASLAEWTGCGAQRSDDGSHDARGRASSVGSFKTGSRNPF